jgi:beta-glucuronidase
VATTRRWLHGAIEQRFTEEYQENLYRHQITMLREIPFLRGMSPWILMDFRSPRRPLAGIQDFYNRKGLVSEKGEKKKAFFVLQEFYRAKGGATLTEVRCRGFGDVVHEPKVYSTAAA